MRISPFVGASSALLLASAASAFRDSSPLFVWSSTPNEFLTEVASEVTTGVISADAVFGSLASLGCDWDRVMVVHMDDLHESHIEAIKLPYASVQADLHIPYLIRPERESLDKSIKSWAEQCGADLVAEGGKVDGIDATFTYHNHAHGSEVHLPEDMPKRHLVLLTGTRDASLAKREDESPYASPIPGRPAPELVSAAAKPTNSTPADGNSTRNGTDGPLLDRVQIFSTPLITGLLIAFGILLPLLLFGIYNLASIQVPPRMLEISKTHAVSKDRKDQ